MAYRDQAAFVITDASIHRSPLAWKFGGSTRDTTAAIRIFSIRNFDEHPAPANINADPAFIHDNLEPIKTDRSAFGVLRPVSKHPTELG